MDIPNLTPYPITEDVWMIPCFVNREENFYQPLCKPFSSDIDWEKLQTRQPWTLVEDDSLRAIIEQRGPRHWSTIARELNSIVHKSLPLRQGKQCRERWYNHLDPGLLKGNWKVEEDIYILEKQLEIGNKWSEIAKNLHGRTENQVKNRWKSMSKKAEKCCPKGDDPISFLISEKKCMENEVKSDSSLSDIKPPPVQMSTGSPGFVPYTFNDLGFSSLADQIKMCYNMGMGSSGQTETTPSPSSLLFFQSPSFR